MWQLEQLARIGCGTCCSVVNIATVRPHPLSSFGLDGFPTIAVADFTNQ